MTIVGPAEFVERAVGIAHADDRGGAPAPRSDARRRPPHGRRRRSRRPDRRRRVGQRQRAARQRIALPGIRKVIQPKTPGQAEYLQKIQDNDIVVGIGPAGTGKTYLAVAAAVDALTRKRVRRIVLARPAVEAGENLGFLPGDMQAKIDPYLRPLYDALDDMMPFERVQRALEQRVIEVAPLAFMRGRTLGDAFVIVDEAQNATTMQMKMLLTRLGVNSQDGHHGRQDAGRSAEARGLGPDAGRAHSCRASTASAFTTSTRRDVVRHRLVRDIVRAYAADAGE